MPRQKRLKDVSPLQELCNQQITLTLLDASKPDLLSINNEVRASIRETRKKVNEIINILNLR